MLHMSKRSFTLKKHFHIATNLIHHHYVPVSPQHTNNSCKIIKSLLNCQSVRNFNHHHSKILESSLNNSQNDQFQFENREYEDPEYENPQVYENIDQLNSRLMIFLLVGTPLVAFGVLKLCEWLDEKFHLDLKELNLKELEQIFKTKFEDFKTYLKEDNTYSKLKLASLLSYGDDSIISKLYKDFNRHPWIWGVSSLHVASYFLGTLLFRRLNSPLFARMFDRHMCVSLNNLYEKRFHTLILSQFTHQHFLSMLLSVLVVNFAGETIGETFNDATCLGLYFGCGAVSCLASSLLSTMLLRRLTGSAMKQVLYGIAKTPRFANDSVIFTAIAGMLAILPDYEIPYVQNYCTNLELMNIFFVLQFLSTLIFSNRTNMVTNASAAYLSYFTIKHLTLLEHNQKERMTEINTSNSYYLGQVSNLQKNGQGILVKEGSVYYGNFEQGKYHGRGKIIKLPREKPIIQAGIFNRHQK